MEVVNSQNRYYLGLAIVVTLMAIYYYGSLFVKQHPYWSVLIGLLLIIGIVFIIKKSMQSPMLREVEVRTLKTVGSSVVSVFSDKSTAAEDRKAIPRDLRNKVWERDFKNKTEGICPVCKREKISFKNFDAGHIRAVAKGAQT